MGEIFENIVMQLIIKANHNHRLPFVSKEIKRWWKKSEEIDLVGLTRHRGISKILLIESKWSANANGSYEIAKLVKKIDNTPFKNFDQIFIGIIARDYMNKVDGCLDIEELVSKIKSNQYLPFKKTRIIL